MSESGAGSAVTDLTTAARLTDGEVLINGEKLFITHGGVADLFVVWVKFAPGSAGAGAVVVPRDAPGLHIDASRRFMSGEPYGVLTFTDCRVPDANVLIPGDGFRKMLSVFNIERLGNASRCLGYGQAALNAAVSHLRERTQFGRRLVEFQGLQWRVAEMQLKLEAARLLLYRAAEKADADLPTGLDTAMAKLACNRAGYEVADDALQLLGAYGYDDASPVSFILRRTRGWMIAGGTTEQLLNRIAAEMLGERFSQRPPRPASVAPEQAEPEKGEQ